jgi:hypothetical protein
VEVDAGTATATVGGGHGDVDGALDRFAELPEDGGGGVAEDGAVAAGEDGGHEAAGEAQAPVSHGVDAVVDAVEATALQAPGDRALVKSRLVELRYREHTMLLRGDFSHRDIGPVAFLSHIESKATGTRSLPQEVDLRSADQARRRTAMS